MRDATRGVPVGVQKVCRQGESRRCEHQPDKVVFSVGSEPTLFMRGILEGDTLLERPHDPAFGERIRSGGHNALLDAFLRKANHGCAKFQGQCHLRVGAARDRGSVSLRLRVRRPAPGRSDQGPVHRPAPGLLRPRPLVVITEFGCCS